MSGGDSLSSSSHLLGYDDGELEQGENTCANHEVHTQLLMFHTRENNTLQVKVRHAETSSHVMQKII